MLSAGDHIIASDDLYGGTNRLLRQVAMRQGLLVDFVDTTNVAAVKNVIKNNTKLVWLETPTNPMMKVVDIELISNLVHGVRKEVCVCVWWLHICLFVSNINFLFFFFCRLLLL